MPTPHRQRQIEAGYADPHHGHDPKAVKQADALAAEDQARLDAAEKARQQAAKTAAKAEADKRAAQAARHAYEIELKKQGRRKTSQRS